VRLAPGIPHALCFERAEEFKHHSDASRHENAKVCLPSLRGAKRRSNPAFFLAARCFAEPVIGRRFAPTRWLAVTESKLRTHNNSTRHHPRKRVIQYSRGRCNRTEKPRRTGYPLSRGMTVVGWARICAIPWLAMTKGAERPHPTSAKNTFRTSAWVSRTWASSDEKSGASPARAITRSRSSPAVSGTNLSLTQSRRICVRS
jgi:hypothetical protein